MMNTEFVENKARNGGGLTMKDSFTKDAAISNCIFKGNTAI